jgi:hypothetical protein
MKKLIIRDALGLVWGAQEFSPHLPSYGMQSGGRAQPGIQHRFS